MDNHSDITIKLINSSCNPISKNRNWKRVCDSFKITLNQNEPSINSLTQVEAEAKVISTSYMITPNPGHTGNTTGSYLTGFKVAIDLSIIQNIVYEDSINGTLCTITKTLPISTFIVLGRDFNLNQKPTVDVCIEDIQIQSINSKEIIESITLFLQAE